MQLQYRFLLPLSKVDLRKVAMGFNLSLVAKKLNNGICGSLSIYVKEKGDKRGMNSWNELSPEVRKKKHELYEKLGILNTKVEDNPTPALLREVLKEIASKRRQQQKPKFGQSHYQFPLKIIRTGLWAQLPKPAKALLPVLGVHANKYTLECFPSIMTLCKFSGYGKVKVVEGIKDLERRGLIKKTRKGRQSVYHLTENACIIRKGTYWPVTRDVIEKHWAPLTPVEKAILPVLGTKARIEDSRYEFDNLLNRERFGVVDRLSIAQIAHFSGVSRRGAIYALNRLLMKNWIFYDFIGIKERRAIEPKAKNIYVVFKKPVEV